MEPERICNKCKINQPLNKYRKYTVKENSYAITCKKCLNELDKIRKQNKRLKFSETLIKCEICNEEKALKNFAKLKKFYKKKVCISCYPEFLTEQKTKWCKKEHDTNINYRLKKSLAARLRNVLKANEITKIVSTMNCIGCNIQYLREWFEYNFTPEMSWDNYVSYWSIEHIIPVNKFTLTNETEKLQCWNWSNMMPVSVKYNSSKKEIDIEQINNILYKLNKFKEEGSTTKWFSEEFVLNIDLVNQKLNMNSS